MPPACSDCLDQGHHQSSRTYWVLVLLWLSDTESSADAAVRGAATKAPIQKLTRMTNLFLFVLFANCPPFTGHDPRCEHRRPQGSAISLIAFRIVPSVRRRKSWNWQLAVWQ